MPPVRKEKPDLERWYSPKEAAELCGFKPTTIYHAISSKELHVMKAGNAVRIPASSLDAWRKSKFEPIFPI